MSTAPSKIGGTYTSQTKVAQGADTRTRVEEEVGRFHVAVDDSAGVDITQRAEHTSEIRPNAVDGDMFVEVLQNASKNARACGSLQQNTRTRKSSFLW